MTIEDDIDRPVERIQWYNRASNWISMGLVIFSIAAYGLTLLWGVFGLKEGHWSTYLMGGAYAIATLLLIISVLVNRRKNKLSDGNCHKCGGVIKGQPPDDWLMKCEDCGQEWVLTGKYERGLK